MKVFEPKLLCLAYSKTKNFDFLQVRFFDCVFWRCSFFETSHFLRVQKQKKSFWSRKNPKTFGGIGVFFSPRSEIFKKVEDFSRKNVAAVFLWARMPNPKRKRKKPFGIFHYSAFSCVFDFGFRARKKAVATFFLENSSTFWKISLPGEKKTPIPPNVFGFFWLQNDFFCF